MRLGIKTRLFLLVICGMGIMTAIFGSVYYYTFKKALLDRALEDQKGILATGALEIDAIIYELDRIALFISGSQSIPSLLGTSRQNMVDILNLPQAAQAALSAYTIYPITTRSVTYQSVFYVADDLPAAHHLYSHSLEDYSNIANRSLSVAYNATAVHDAPWYQTALSYNTKVYSFTLPDVPQYVFFAKLVRNDYLQRTDSIGNMGVLVFSVHINDIAKRFQSAMPTPNTNILLLSADQVLSGYIKEIPYTKTQLPQAFVPVQSLKKDGNLHRLTFERTDYLAARFPLSWDLEMVAMIPERDITQSLDNTLYILLLQLLAFLLLSFAFAALISSLTTKPVLRLAQQMEGIRQAEQLVQVRPKKDRGDEISRLYASYNHMIRRILKLMEDIRQKTLLQKKAEIMALQSQINPHFIYNTLDTANWIAMCEGQKEISVIVTSLADIFRYSIRDPDSLVTLEEELAHLNKYLTVQAMRYQDKFTVSIEIPPQYSQYKVPKLTIQPLVENSLLHVLDSEIQVKIRLYLNSTANSMQIHVCDNGRNADAERINSHLAAEDGAPEQKDGIGIRNLNRRVHIHFGDSYGLRYERIDEELHAILSLPPASENLPTQ